MKPKKVKPVKAWGIMNESGHIVADTVRATKRNCISDWLGLLRTNCLPSGHHAVRVTITIDPPGRKR